MKALASVCLVLVFVLVALSAYLRLAHSGIGCADWPACYGRIGQPTQVEQPRDSGQAYARLVDASGQALAWATPLHRLVASVLGLLIFFLFAASLLARRQRVLSAVLLALTAWLAVLGLRSGGLHDPSVVVGNLAGGFAMLGMLGWLVFSRGHRGAGPKWAGLLVSAAIVALALQILLGGLTSARFAALSCNSLPDCNGSWWPGPALAQAFDLSATHTVDAQGRVTGGEERQAIHKAHRLGALAVLVLVLTASAAAAYAGVGLGRLALLTSFLAAAGVVSGAAAVALDLALELALSHNTLAALTLLALLKLLARVSDGPKPLNRSGDQAI